MIDPSAINGKGGISTKANFQSQVADYQAKQRRRQWWYKIVSVLACVVVFCTTYALILPAITMEAPQILACPLEVHTHSEDCYDADGNLVCGEADFIVHVHNDSCYDENGDLVCVLPEIEVHEHTDECYTVEKHLICELEEREAEEEPEAPVETVVHEHDKSCYAIERGKLICENRDEDHEHTGECYEWVPILACRLEEGERVPVETNMAEAVLVSEKGLDADAEPAPTREKVLGGGGHVHTDECYEIIRTLTCEQEEIILHTHTEDCYEYVEDENGEAVKKLTCGLLQVEEHQHGSDCFVTLDETSLSEDSDDEEQELPVAPNGAVISAYAIVEEKASAARRSPAYGISILDTETETDTGYTDMADTLTNAAILINGEEYDGSALDKNSPFSITLTSTVSNNELKYVYKIPEQIHVQNTSETALMSGTEQVGKYWIQDGVLYVEYKQSYTSVTSGFELSATWDENVDNSTTIQWSDTLKTDVTFQDENIQIQKTDSSSYKLVNAEDGGLYIEYIVRTVVTSGGTLTITDTFTDTVSNATYPHMTELWEGAFEGDNDYKLTIYTLKTGGDPTDQGDYAAGNSTYGNFADVTENGNNGQTLTTGEITLDENQYAELRYMIKVSPENRAKLDVAGAYLSLQNTAKAEAETTYSDQPLTASTTHNASYSPAAGWIQKEARSDSSGEKDDGWAITVNYGRTADMDGFALLDDLQSGAKGYKTGDGAFQLQIQGKDGATTIDLQVIDIEEKIEAITSVTSYSRQDVIDFLTALFTGVGNAQSVNEINAYLSDDDNEGFISYVLTTYFGVVGNGANGAVTLSDLSRYVFVDNGTNTYTADSSAPLFFWFSPETSVVEETFEDRGIGSGPYSYTIRYQTDASDTTSPVGVVNSAQAAWRGVVTGTEPVFSNPQVQLTKGNGGVYEGEDGGLYVDWTIEVTVPGNSSGLNDVWLVDTLPTAKVTVAGQQYDTMPALQGLNSDTLDASKIEYKDGVMTAETQEYLMGIVGNGVFKINVESDGGGVSRNVTAMLGAPEISQANCFMAYQGAAAKLGTMYLENYEGYTSVSPRVFSVHLGTLPSTEGSEEGYTITVTYTTKVNPNTMPLATQNYVEAVNKVALYSKLDGVHDTKLAEDESEYWLAKQEAEDSVVKNIVSYDTESRILTYRVQIDPLNNLEAGQLVYQLHDILTDYPGAVYIENSFKLYIHAKVVSGLYNPTNNFWQYDSEIEHLIWSSDTEDEAYLDEIIPNDAADKDQEAYKTEALYQYLITAQKKEIPVNGTAETVSVTPLTLDVDNDNGEYRLTLSNTGWMSTTLNEGTKVVPMTLEYQVKLPETTEGLGAVINNQVTFTASDLALPGVTALIGVSRASYDTQDILNKSMIKTPNSANGYTAQFRIVVNKTELEAQMRQNAEDAGETFTGLTEIVIHDEVENLNVDTFSVVLEGLKTEADGTSSWVVIDDTNWFLSVDPDNLDKLTVTIRDVDDTEAMPYMRYRLTYLANVVGNQEETVHYSNTASMNVDGVSAAHVEEEVYLQKNSGSSEVTNINITIAKVDGNNASEVMQGVEFELYTYNAETGNWEKQAVEKTLQTGSDSQVALVNGQNGISLNYGTWYCLKETKAKEGYRLAAPLYFYITDPNNAGNVPEDPSHRVNGTSEAWPGGTALDSDSRQVIYNFQPYFRVEKYDGSDGTRIWDGVEFTLYFDRECTTMVQRPKTSSDGVFTFSELKMGTTYYLKETKVPDGYIDPEIIYTVVIDKDGSVTFTPENGTAQAPMEGHTYSFQVDNTPTNPYELPETGGAGTTLFTIGGLLLLAGAVGYGYGLRRRRERRVN